MAIVKVSSPGGSYYQDEATGLTGPTPDAVQVAVMAQASGGPNDPYAGQRSPQSGQIQQAPAQAGGATTDSERQNRPDVFMGNTDRRARHYQVVDPGELKPYTLDTPLEAVAKAGGDIYQTATAPVVKPFEWATGIDVPDALERGLVPDAVDYASKSLRDPNSGGIRGDGMNEGGGVDDWTADAVSAVGGAVGDAVDSAGNWLGSTNYAPGAPPPRPSIGTLATQGYGPAPGGGYDSGGLNYGGAPGYGGGPGGTPAPAPGFADTLEATNPYGGPTIRARPAAPVPGPSVGTPTVVGGGPPGAALPASGPPPAPGMGTQNLQPMSSHEVALRTPQIATNQSDQTRSAQKDLAGRVQSAGEQQGPGFDGGLADRNSGAVGASVDNLADYAAGGGNGATIDRGAANEARGLQAGAAGAASGVAAAGGNGANIDLGRSDASRSGQSGLLDQLSAFAQAPEGPSEAEALLLRGQERAQRSAIGNALSVRGGPMAQAQAMRGANAEAAFLAQEGAAEMAALRARESATHRSQVLESMGVASNTLQGQRASDIMQAVEQGQLDNAAAARQLEAIGLSGDIANQIRTTDAGLATDQARLDDSAAGRELDAMAKGGELASTARGQDIQQATADYEARRDNANRTLDSLGLEGDILGTTRGQDQAMAIEQGRISAQILGDAAALAGVELSINEQQQQRLGEMTIAMQKVSQDWASLNLDERKMLTDAMVRLYDIDSRTYAAIEAIAAGQPEMWERIMGAGVQVLGAVAS